MNRRSFFETLSALLMMPMQLIARSYYLLSEKQIACVERRVELELRLNPQYVWGAAGLDPGAPGDCSGKLYAIFFS
jgi:hypothetical protein